MLFLRILVGIFLISTIVFAEQVYIYEPKLLRVRGINRATLAELIEQSVVELGYEVTRRKSKARLFLKAKLMRLGKYYIFQIKGSNGKYAKRKAKTIESLDKVIDLAVQNILGGAEKGFVKLDHQGLRDKGGTSDKTRKTKKSSGIPGSFYLGLPFFGKLGTSGPGILLINRGISLFDTPNIGIGIGFEFAFDGFVEKDGDEPLSQRFSIITATMSSLTVEISYLPFGDAVSPYIAINGGLASAKHSERGIQYGGMQIGGMLGIATLKKKGKTSRIIVGFRGALIQGTGYLEDPRYIAFILGGKI